MHKYEIGFIGSGNMASAIARQLINSNAVNSEKVIMCDMSAEKLHSFEKMGTAVTEDPNEVVKNAKYVFLGTKPQGFETVANQIKGSIRSDALISIMAGVNLARIIDSIGSLCPDVVRIMPNLACGFGKGMVLVNFDKAKEQSTSEIMALLKNLGEVAVMSEDDFNFGTAISGCGPAFFYTFYNAMMSVCLEYGFDEVTAKKLVVQTAIGSAELTKCSDEKMEKLISNVCSVGGSTIEGVKVLNNSDLQKIVSQAILASKKRNDELEKI